MRNVKIERLQGKKRMKSDKFRTMDLEKVKENVLKLRQMERYLEDIKESKSPALDEDMSTDMDSIGNAISHLHSKITESNCPTP